ncbi:MAG: nucleotide sugar dehydrogenase [Pseudomonadota bacterium]
MSEIRSNTRYVIDGLLKKYREKDITVGVIGLGYVGLPICLAMSSAGFRAIGFDIDRTKAEMLNIGKSYIKHIPTEAVASAMNTGRFTATSDMSRLRDVDAILICVPTPIDEHMAPDLSFVVSTCETITQYLKADQLVILESTTYPGTTREVVLPILQSSGLSVGRDIFLAFSPEREDPGNNSFSTSNIPKVVGADDEESLTLAVTLYNGFVESTVPVYSTATAEAVKITENVFRAVNIALVNELKVVFSNMGVDIWKVIEAAKTKPFGYMPFYPGPGLGGHCIPIDPFYLAWKARGLGQETRFIELAGHINRAMPARVVATLTEALSHRAKKSLNGSRILIIGLAYKKNIDDTRESPALELIELLEARGANVDYHDPHVPEIPQTREHARLAGRKSRTWDAAVFASDFDAVLIATDHDGLDYVELAAACSIVVDTRNACARSGADMSSVVPA